MTDKQFNYILRQLRADIMRSVNDKAFPITNDSVYVDGVMVVCVDDVFSTLNTYWGELLEDEK